MARSRVLFDTNVLVSAFLTEGKPWRCFNAAAAGRIVLVSSVHVITELVEVLTRPRLDADPDQVATFLEYLNELADIVPVGTVGEPMGCRDPDDELVMAAAVLGKADAIVTGDRDLLDLADPPVRILTVEQLLAELALSTASSRSADETHLPPRGTTFTHLPGDRTPTGGGIMAQQTTVRGTTFTEPNDTTIVAERMFDAPRQLVWDAHTKCEHLQRWQTGPEGGTMPTCEMDLRPGGKWRNIYGDPTGTFEMSGEYREIVPPERMVNTETYEGNTALDTMTLTEEGGITKLTVSVQYPSHEALEGAKSTGMEDGWADSYVRLDEYLKTLK